MFKVGKFLFVTVMCMSLPFLAHSQEVGFGLKGGLNLTTLNFDDPEASYDSKAGFHAGIFLRSKFDRIALQPEVLFFTQKGDMKSSVFGTAEESFTYISVPVMVKFYPVAGLNLQVGPQFAFLIDGERKYETLLGSGKADITDYYKKSDISLSAGAGYDFPFGLNIDFRYNLGLKDINNVAEGEPVKSRVFLVSLGWNFIRN
jgi:hypothetical protein